MPGSSFGEAAAGHIRISLGQPEEVLADAATRIRPLRCGLFAQTRRLTGQGPTAQNRSILVLTFSMKAARDASVERFME